MCPTYDLEQDSFVLATCRATTPAVRPATFFISYVSQTRRVRHSLLDARRMPGIHLRGAGYPIRILVSSIAHFNHPPPVTLYRSQILRDLANVIHIVHTTHISYSSYEHGSQEWTGPHGSDSQGSIPTSSCFPAQQLVRYSLLAWLR